MASGDDESIEEVAGFQLGRFLVLLAGLVDVIRLAPRDDVREHAVLAEEFGAVVPRNFEGGEAHAADGLV